MNVFRNGYDVWRDIMDNKSDPRTTNWFMMSSPLPTIFVSLSYIVAVKIICPRIMKNRKPMNVKWLQLCFDIFHLVFNFVLFYRMALVTWPNNYSFRCEPVDFADHGVALEIAQGSWIYFLSKFTDFFETFIFVLMKRFDMISLYHVAHHSIMPVSTWWGVKFMPGGHSIFFGYINLIVHVVLYTYFVLVTVFPQAKRYLFWWKTFLPFFQIVQFALVFVHAFQLLWSNECNYPVSFVYFIGSHAVVFLFLVRNKMQNDQRNREKSGADYKKDDDDEGIAKKKVGLRQKAYRMFMSSNICFNLDIPE